MPYILLVCLLFCSTSYGQAVWNGRTYNQPVCSNPSCRMCNSIRNQLYEPQFTYTKSVASIPTTSNLATSASPSAPTPLELVPLIFDLLEPTPTDVFIDIGSGDGRVLKEALNYRCKVLGVDLTPTLISGADVTTGDARLFNYSQVTMAYLYLYPDLMEQVIERLPKGTKIVSYSHTTHQIAWKRFGNFYLGIR